ncbi:bromodomain adjacent to zinc finger domain protein 2A isoform X4 [Phyllopteryx taeniolatus]|uniref:bromodomain adjacent to zinc finger domain protein 2A isoform X4 n=1 Tax=Phyllopteryx taeniolatus TaxID=161469 RepID=UPI002AD2738A|nr:bromodomain adjacent to zinc finger domain protein 2A isoform X4 [Phyllopteryx taeniolatus]
MKGLLVMEANNHFNYGTHSSANSGLKRSSGDSLYTNGSSVSFPHQGKNMNGEMNVNGVTTALGSGAPASQPSSSPYPLISNHHQSSMGYLWGGHPQYSPTMATSPGHGLHQKQPSPGMVQPQSQHHFQAQGQYQLNGDMESSQQSPLAGPSNMSPPSQFWNRSNPAPQAAAYTSRSMYGTYESQSHPSISPPQQQVSPPSSQHQPHSHLRPPLHLPQHYGVMTNGMPYYHQQLASLPSPQHPKQSTPQGQRMQNFASPHDTEGGSSRAMTSSSTVQDGGSPMSREKASHISNMSTSKQGHTREEGMEANTGCNHTEESAVVLRPPNSSSFSVRQHTSDHQESSEKPTAQPPEGVRGTGVSTSPGTMLIASSSSATVSLNKVSSATSVESPMTSPASTLGSYSDVKSTSTQSSSAPPPRHSSPPLPTPSATELKLSGSKHLVGASSSSSPATHPKFCPPPGFTDSISRPQWVSSSPSSESQVHHSVSGPITAVLSPAIVSTSSYSGSTPISSLQQMVQGSKPPLMPAVKSNLMMCDASGSIHSSIASPLLGSSPGMSQSTHGIPSASNKLAALPQHDSLYTASAVGSGRAIASVSPPPKGLKSPSQSAHDNPSARSLATVPLRTTQGSSTAPVSVPPATSSEMIQSSDSVQHPATSSPGSMLNEMALLPEHHGHSNKGKGLLTGKGTMAKECHPHLESGKVNVHKASDPQKSSDLSGQLVQTERQPSNIQKEPMATGSVRDVLNTEETLSRISMPLDHPSAKHSSLTVETSFDHSLLTTSQYGDSSVCSTLSRIHISSFLDKSLAKSTSRIHDVSSFGNSFHLGNGTSQFASTSHTEQPSSVYETTSNGSLSLDYSSLNTTYEQEMSEAGESMLESSLNNTSFGPSHPRHQGTEAGWPTVGHHTPDSDAVSKTPTAIEIMTPPSFKMRDENFITFSTPAHRPAVHPLQPVTDQVLSATAGRLKSPGQTCKPQSPKALWIRKSAPEEAKRKPRGRTPKVEKIKPEGGDAKEEGVKGRKRKATLRPEQAKGTPNKCGQTQPPSEEIDSITATIEAVLANTSAISSPFDKPKKMKRMKQVKEDMTTLKDDAGAAASDAEDNEEESSPAGKGEPSRRRVATEQQVQFPLLHGWKREIRVKKMNDRMKGETWYYTPCGRRMKQFPEVIKYLKKHQGGIVTREHFSFSPRMPVGDFYEERESPEGVKWFLLANEEVPSMIMAITGRRGRPPNPDKEKPSRVRGLKARQARRPGRPPKPKMIDFLSKVDAKLLKRLEDKEALTEEEKEKMTKIKKKMKRKARIRRREDANIKKIREDKKRAKQEAKSREVKAEPPDPTGPQTTEPASQSVDEPKKPGRRRSVKVEVPPPIQQTDEERIAQGKRVLSARSKAKALAKAQAEAEAAARAALAAKKTAERRVQTQRRLEERRRQQLIAEELRKPTEDMCLTDHKPLPELSLVPGVILSGTAFAHCLAVVEFLHGYGKLIGLNVPKDIPSLATLQEGLLDMGESQWEVQDLLIKLMEAALRDPGLPPYYQSVKILGDKLVELQLTRSTVSEVLRIFLESHGYETEVCNTLRTKSFHALPPETKAAVLGFVAEELNSSNIVTSDIDNTLENMVTYRKNKWIIEGKLRKLKAALARRTGRSEEELCLEERRRSARVAEEENLGLEESVAERSNRRGRKDEPRISDSDVLMTSIGEAPTDLDTPAAPEEVPATTQTSAIPDCTPPLPGPFPSAQMPPASRTPTTRARPGRRRRRGSRGGSPARRGPRGAAAKGRGRPAASAFDELEKQYFIQLVVKPIPASMVRGWWWIKDPEELFSTLQALHPRGIREKVLHKHLAKHMESLTEMCTKAINDPVFKIEEQKEGLLEALQQPWQVQEKAMETDNSALRWVEDLEQRVIAADLHLKAPPQNIVTDVESNTEAPAAEFQPYTIPERDSTRADLQYYEHDADPRDDWIIRTKKEWSGLPRIATHPLDLAVLRLANLERNIERRYLKEPLWNPAEVMRLAPLTPTPGEEQPMDVISLESEITSRLRTWRQALDRCRSAPQLCLCLLQLEKAIAWERSVTKVTCQICRKGDNDDCLLLCDACDCGCHMYCLKPKITQVPEGDWFCPTCVVKEESVSPNSRKRTRVKKKRYEENSSDDDTTTRRSSGMATRHKEAATAALVAASSSSRPSGEGGPAKRRRMTTRNQPDLTFCEIILMEMEAHADAWPFLEPVNPRLVPGYRRIIKNPMDFLTMRERLLQGGYCSCEEFAADAQLVFNNCELFNEDTSEVGMAGHSMRRFFESRWAEFYSNKDK